MKFNPARLAKRSAAIFIVSLACSAFFHWRSHSLPSPARVASQLKAEPLQTPITMAPFEETRKGYTYKIIPRFSYTLYGLVVELNDSFAWYDITHVRAKDFLNTRDLCVVWGDDAFSGLLDRISFSHGDWTCYFFTRDGEAFQKFRQNQFSNNHVIPANEEIARSIESADISDQIEMKGYLADYENHGFTRHTSITREDTGNGACEIIYVTEFNILNRTNGLWMTLHFLARIATGLSAMVAVLAFFVLPYFPQFATED